MTKVLVTEQHLASIAQAIREKLDTEDTYRPGDMAAAIREIDGYPEPTGTISIAQNGTANVKDYAAALVNVQPVLQQKTVTQNGTVAADAGYDGLSSVTVNVSGGGGKEYVFDQGVISGYPPVNIYNGAQSSEISYNSDGSAHILGSSNNRRFLGFLIDLTGVASIQYLCRFQGDPQLPIDTIGVIASQTAEQIMNHASGSISIFPAYTTYPPKNVLTFITLDTSALTGPYYVGILGYEENWSSDLWSMWIVRGA